MDTLQATVADYGTGIFFILAMIEGPLVVLAATALALMGTMDLRWVWGLAILADLAGDVLLYAVGRFIPDMLPQRFRPHMAQEKVGLLFRQHGVRVLLVAKLTHFAGLPTLISAGFGRMAFVPFLVWSLIGTVLKVSVIVLTGWYFWQAVAAGDMSDAVVALAVVLGACALGFLFLRCRRWI